MCGYMQSNTSVPHASRIKMSIYKQTYQSRSEATPAANTRSADDLTPTAALLVVEVDLTAVPELVPVEVPLVALVPLEEPVLVAAVPVAVAAEDAPERVVAPAKAKRSVDWKVWQLDEAGMRGVYGGGVFRGSGIDHVDATDRLY